MRVIVVVIVMLAVVIRVMPVPLHLHASVNVARAGEAVKRWLGLIVYDSLRLC